MKYYQSALDILFMMGSREMGFEMNYEKEFLQELVDKEIELESRKDKLIVGSEWECLVEHHVEHIVDGEFYIIEEGQIISITNVTKSIVAFKTDVLKCVDNHAHFMLCFIPKGEKK